MTDHVCESEDVVRQWAEDERHNTTLACHVLDVLNVLDKSRRTADLLGGALIEAAKSFTGLADAVLTSVAEGGSTAEVIEVIEVVATWLDGGDALDDDNIALYERAKAATPKPSCPHVSPTDEGTSHCTLAQRGTEALTAALRDMAYGYMRIQEGHPRSAFAARAFRRACELVEVDTENPNWMGDAPAPGVEEAAQAVVDADEVLTLALENIGLPGVTVDERDAAIAGLAAGKARCSEAMDRLRDALLASSRPPAQADPEDEPPHKRLRLTLDLEAHDMGDLTARLESIATYLCVEKGETVDRVSGSYVLKVTCNPDMDEARFVAELEDWIEKRREAKRA